MADPRMVEMMFERALESLTLLTRQVSRVAWALEAPLHRTLMFENIACPNCGCSIVLMQFPNCPVCDRPKDKPNG